MKSSNQGSSGNWILPAATRTRKLILSQLSLQMRPERGWRLCCSPVKDSEGRTQLSQTQTPNPQRLWNKKMRDGGCPGGSEVKNQPASAGDTASTPGPGRSHMRLSDYAWALKLGSPIAEPACSNYWGPSALELLLCNKKSHCNENPMHCNLRGSLAPHT